jgi:signal peptidase II
MPMPQATPDPSRAEAAGTAVGRSRRLFWIAVTIGLVTLAADQLSKWWAITHLSSGEPIKVIGSFITFQLVYNPGAAFSTGTGVTWVFTIVSGLAAIATVIIAWLGLVFGGALTHFGDRLLRPPSFGNGHVVDFINYDNFFIGNVADIAIVVGVCLVVLAVLLGIHLRGHRIPTSSD